MSSPSRPTLKSVAAHAGVSVTTTADILRATPEQLSRYHADTVAKVRDSAAALHYQPNRLAAALVSGRSRTVMLLMERAYEPYFARVARAMETLVRDAGYEMFVVDAAHFQTGRRGLWPVDGILAVEGEAWQEVALQLRPQVATPLVSLGTCGIAGYDQVRIDLPAAMAAAARHLIAQGAQNILYLDQQPLSAPNLAATYLDPFKAAAAAIKKARRSLVRLATTQPTAAAAKTVLLDYLQQQPRPDAILCRTDDLALGASSALLEHGLTPGREVLLVGCNGMEELAFYNPPLSTLAFPVEAMCAAAWEMMQQRLDQPGQPPQRLDLSIPLVVRMSSSQALK